MTTQDKAALLDALLAADDMWTDYGRGFRVHFSFRPPQRCDWLARLNSARLEARAAAALEPQEPGE